MPPDEMFQFIKSPALALSGQYDLNVPPDHDARIVQELRKAGNHNCTCITIPGCDHRFQISPKDEQARQRERYNFDSFKREHHLIAFTAALGEEASEFAHASVRLDLETQTGKIEWR